MNSAPGRDPLFTARLATILVDTLRIFSRCGDEIRGRQVVHAEAPTIESCSGTRGPFMSRTKFGTMAILFALCALDAGCGESKGDPKAGAPPDTKVEAETD